MTTRIYYFTGTGNALYVARTLGEKIGDAEIIPIPGTADQTSIAHTGAVGIVCPIYMFNLPYIVIDFIKKLQQPDYFFIVFAGGGETGNCIKAVKKLADAQQLRLSAVFNLAMPSNYAPFGATPGETQKAYFAAAGKEIPRIAQVVNDRNQYVEKRSTGFFQTWIHPGILYRLGYRYITFMDKGFSADERCDGCGVCEQVCPVDNVTLNDGRPEWHSRCQQCYACLQWCPQEAIQYRDKTEGVPRYHHPNVTLKEIIKASRKEL
ncbi:EFR1 family ferrodoxin [bacterium]|nr:EFR1 family ferrodoxin [bacterium]